MHNLSASGPSEMIMAEDILEFEFEARETIVSERDAVSSVFFIRYGSVSLSKSLADGRCQLVDVLGRGGVFGLGTSRQSSVTVETLVRSGVALSHACRRWLTRTPVRDDEFPAGSAAGSAPTRGNAGCLTSIERIATFLLTRGSSHHGRSTSGDADQRPVEVVLG